MKTGMIELEVDLYQILYSNWKEQYGEDILTGYETNLNDVSIWLSLTRLSFQSYS